MLGAVIGDVAGSRFEGFLGRSDRVLDDPWGFELFAPNCRPTDDTVMTFAIARALREADGDFALLAEASIDAMHEFGNRYPRAGYGGKFARWLGMRLREPYQSFGNGSAMRVSPVGWAYPTLEETLEAARITAAVTHDHPEGIAGAQATARAIFLARSGAAKDGIRRDVSEAHGYDLGRTLARIRPAYSFDVTCQGSVPEAIIAFLESGSVEEAVRLAIWLRGDTDTQGAIAGSVAEAFFGIPEELERGVLPYLDGFLLGELALWRGWLARRNAKDA